MKRNRMQLPWLLAVRRVRDIHRYLLVQVGWKGSWGWQLGAQLHLQFTHRQPCMAASNAAAFDSYTS